MSIVCALRLQKKQSFAHLYAEKGCVEASPAQGTAVPLKKCPLLVSTEICNLFMLLAIARLLFVQDTMGSLTSTNECWQIGFPFNVHLGDGTHIDESLPVKHQNDSL